MRLLIALLLALPASADPITKAGDVLKNRDALHGRSVCVVGKADKMEERFGTVTGKHLFRGKFTDGTGELIVFNYGHFPKIAPGEPFQACGRFLKSYTAPSGNIYLNQITTSVILKGSGINAGLVDIVDGRIVPQAKGKASAQTTRPPAAR